MSAKKKMLLPSRLAAELGVSVPTIYRWIRARQLGATILRPKGKKRPTYRITPAALVVFLRDSGNSEAQVASILESILS